MKLHELKYTEGARRDKKRIGRGQGSGNGKTSGKGNKGQNARLAVRLTACKIDIKSAAQMEAIRTTEAENAANDDLDDEVQLIDNAE